MVNRPNHPQVTLLHIKTVEYKEFFKYKTAFMPLDSRLSQFVKLQNQFQDRFGNFIAWGSLSLVLITALVVIMRYAFNTGSIAMQEAIMYNHAILFMLGIAYTYQHNQHVRVDVFYGQFSIRRKAWVNLLGSLIFTLPVMVFIIWSSWDYVIGSWLIQEGSAEAGGIEYLYLLKALIPIMAVLVILQAFAVIAQTYLTLFTYPPTPLDEEPMEGKL